MRDYRNPALLTLLALRHGPDVDAILEAHDFEAQPSRVEAELEQHGLLDDPVPAIGSAGGQPAADGGPAAATETGDVAQDGATVREDDETGVEEPVPDSGPSTPSERAGADQGDVEAETGQSSTAATADLAREGQDSRPEVDEQTEPDPYEVLGVDDPDAIESFEDLSTPDWMDAGSFYSAVDVATDVGELQMALDWGSGVVLEAMLDLLGIDLDE